MRNIDLNLVDESFELFDGEKDGTSATSTGTGTTASTTETKTGGFDQAKFTETIGAVGSALGSGLTLYKAYENPAKAQMRQTKKQQKAQLKEVCGRKPVKKEKLPEYQKCVETYMKGATLPQAGMDMGGTRALDQPTTGMSNNTKVLIAVAVLGIAGFVYYKYFMKKSA